MLTNQFHVHLRSQMCKVFTSFHKAGFLLLSPLTLHDESAIICYKFSPTDDLLIIYKF